MTKNEWRDFFSYTKSERRGIFILSILILLVILYNIFDPLSVVKTYDYTDFEISIANYEAAKDSIEKSKKEYSKKSYKSKSYPIKFKLNYFNPNDLSKSEWIKIGLKEYQANSITKYVRKGGRFFNPNDLRKMYCLSKFECDKIIPYIVIEEEFNKKTNIKEFRTLKFRVLSLELNTVSFDSLLEVKGIGPVTAKGIIKYRNILGGYYSVSQLKEVYSIDSARYEMVKPNFYVNLDSIQTRILINEATYYQLKKHPYISKKQAYEIPAYRDMHGAFRKIEDLINVNSINDSVYQKIYRYFALKE